MLFDLTELHFEKASAWGSNLDFGQQSGDRVDKMAIVGDNGWEKRLTTLAERRSTSTPTTPGPG